MNIARPIRRMFRSDAATMAVADQLCMVGGNFLLTILVARHCSPEDFATFSILYSLIVLLSFMQGPLINEPLVLSTRQCPRTKIGVRADTATVLIFAPLSALSALFALSQSYAEGITTLLLLCTAGLTSSLYWSSKSALHAAGRHRSAFIASLLGTSSLLLLACGASSVADMSVNGALAAIAGASAIGYSSALVSLRTVATKQLRADRILNHSRVGIPLSALAWLAGNATFLLLAHHERLGDVAGLKAVLTLLLPLNQIMIGMSSFLLPLIVQQQRDGEERKARAGTKRILIGSVATSAIFALALYPFSAQLLTAIYGEEYGRYATSLQIGAAALPVCWAVVTILRTYFRASAKPIHLLTLYLATLAVGVPLSALLIDLRGPAAPVLSFITIQATLAIGFIFTFLRTRP